MNCCFCKQLDWSLFPDQFHIDPFNVESLHNALSNVGKDLADIIALATLFNTCVTSVKDLITLQHSHCLRCSHCNSTLSATIISDSTKNSIIDIASQYYLALSDSQFSILKKLANCLPEMCAIDSMIGMFNIKHEFVRLIKFLATTDRSSLNANSCLMHMVISGPPGHGKTEIAKLLGNAFRKSGLLTKDTFIIATRADLIGAYCGHTAKDTTEMFDKARGGVIFIDEVYSLGNSEKRDVFTSECINTINQLLSERADTLCIVAGYEKEINDCFFSYNPGLQRRFPWRFNIKPYSDQDLVDIFYKKIADLSYSADPYALIPSDISSHRHLFQNAGGDISNLVTFATLAHFDNTFLSTGSSAISRLDVLAALNLLINSKPKQPLDLPPPHMYS